MSRAVRVLRCAGKRITNVQSRCVFRYPTWRSEGRDICFPSHICACTYPRRPGASQPAARGCEQRSSDRPSPCLATIDGPGRYQVREAPPKTPDVTPTGSRDGP
ncbi:hypothetical protein BDW22DRAFT_184331 [Trametopsis cervina]|nr:hypothetical protein BDW22DRAFT_184331 [Trametopsis cervina]